jgi:hypothetical protein
MGRLGRGWRLAKVSLGVLRQDKELIVFPLISLLVTGVLWGSWVYAALIVPPPFIQDLPQWAYYGLFFLFYVLAFFIGVYFNSALVGAASTRLQGGNPTVRDGFRAANAHLRNIFAWSLLAATVGLALRVLAERSGMVGRIITGIIGLAWSLATFFVVPVLVLEGVGPVEAIHRSASLFRKTWGETIVGSLGLGLIFFLLGLLGIVGPLIGFLLGGVTGLLVGIAAAVVYWLILGLVATAARAVLVTALYRFATTGEVPDAFPPDIARAFGAP